MKASNTEDFFKEVSEELKLKNYPKRAKVSECQLKEWMKRTSLYVCIHMVDWLYRTAGTNTAKQLHSN